MRRRQPDFGFAGPGAAREVERIEQLLADGPPHSPRTYDNPDTIFAGPDMVEISLVDPLPQIMTAVLAMTPAERRELYEQLKP